MARTSCWWSNGARGAGLPAAGDGPGDRVRRCRPSCWAGRPERRGRDLPSSDAGRGALGRLRVLLPEAGARVPSAEGVRVVVARGPRRYDAWILFAARGGVDARRRRRERRAGARAGGCCCARRTTTSSPAIWRRRARGAWTRLRPRAEASGDRAPSRRRSTRAPVAARRPPFPGDARRGAPGRGSMHGSGQRRASCCSRRATSRRPSRASSAPERRRRRRRWLDALVPEIAAWAVRV